jgi:hypothetical protein
VTSAWQRGAANEKSKSAGPPRARECPSAPWRGPSPNLPGRAQFSRRVLPPRRKRDSPGVAPRVRTAFARSPSCASTDQARPAFVADARTWREWRVASTTNAAIRSESTPEECVCAGGCKRFLTSRRQEAKKKTREPESAFLSTHFHAFHCVLHNPRRRDVHFLAQRATLHNPVGRYPNCERAPDRSVAYAWMGMVHNLSPTKKKRHAIRNPCTTRMSGTQNMRLPAFPTGKLA